MKRGLLLLLVVAVLSGLVVPVAAASPTRFKLLSGEVSTVAVSDRYLVYDTHYGRALRALDTRSGKARVISLPTSCGISIDGRVLSASGHYAVLDCDALTSLLMDLRTGEQNQLAAPSVGALAQTSYAMRLGTHWMLAQVACADYAHYCNAARNVTTGEQRLLTTPFFSETYVNPDDPDLGSVSFCSPWDAQARKLGQRPGTQWQQWIRIEQRRRQAVIAHCGSQTTHRLVPQSTIHGVDSSLSGGWTTWGRSPCRRSAREHAYAYEPSTRRTWDWTLPKINGRTRCLDRTLHTSHTLVAVVNDELHADESIEFNTYRLFIAHRPR